MRNVSAGLEEGLQLKNRLLLLGIVRGLKKKVASGKRTFETSEIERLEILGDHLLEMADGV